MPRLFWLLLVMGASTFPVAFLVNRVVPDPYMDEIFHIPQTQQYCQGDFRRWDPMITTLPGLYYISLLYTSALHLGFWVLGLKSSLPDLCSPPILRSVNICLSILCAFLFREITVQLEPNISGKMASMKAIVMAWYPLHWFFNFLFYTDVGSTTAVMAMYLACLKKAYWTSGLFGILAILFRQTNVVWIVFVTFVGVKDYLGDQHSGEDLVDVKDMPLASCKGHPSIVRQSEVDGSSAQIRRRHNGIPKNTSLISSNPVQKSSLKIGSSTSYGTRGLLEEILSLARRIWYRKLNLIWQFFIPVIGILTFILFVLYNGSIVIGAKEAHKAVPHFAQLMYFAMASSVALAPIHFNPCWIRECFQKFAGGASIQLQSCIVTGFIAALTCVHKFSFSHPYLVADNRHYTFYIWRKVINANWITKYLLTPLYVYGWSSIIIILGKVEDKIWILVFCLGVTGSIVPAPLIEFRYYTVPFYFLALHMPVKKSQESTLWLLIAFEYLVVNILTMYIFLFKPFSWSDTAGLQRFIW
eukprot:c255_g1_i1 orf=129-1709(+)